jgi:hypothetical protein
MCLKKPLHSNCLGDMSRLTNATNSYQCPSLNTQPADSGNLRPDSRHCVLLHLSFRGSAWHIQQVVTPDLGPAIATAVVLDSAPQTCVVIGTAVAAQGLSGTVQHEQHMQGEHGAAVVAMAAAAAAGAAAVRLGARERLQQNQGALCADLLRGSPCAA